MKIVAVTACPTGIAHTYMAAEQLERTGRSLGHEVKVETQGAMGIENRLSEEDIGAAELVIFAADIEIEERQRFDGLPLIEVPAQLAIKDPAAIFARIGS
ncbi:MAG TPA: PTS fructose transporter subunit IIB [Firmicutes bacterium]|nr:PTS fructose transporter subunit IIB [Bacillota bacterium]